MAEGKVLAEGTLDEIKANEQVIEAYLGTGLKNKDMTVGWAAQETAHERQSLPGRSRQQGPLDHPRRRAATIAPPGPARRSRHIRRGPTGEPFLIGDTMTGGYGGAGHPARLHHRRDPGEIAVIVGPNGAGKSTAMKAVFGMLNLRQGRCGWTARISPPQPAGRVAKGMGFVPQTSNIFTSMTVEENLEMGAFIRDDISRDDGAGL
jgi:ATPase subunit of ABC transporter with duplicated ATPase domains